MPTQWTAELDFKLAAAIIAMHQVKVTKDDSERLAAIIGDGCTPKAITHRVQKFRDMATELGLRGGTAATTPTTGTKRGRKPKTDEDQNGDATEATPTKKAKQTPKTPKAKKVVAPKIENDGTDTEEAIKEEETAEEGSENTV